MDIFLLFFPLAFSYEGYIDLVLPKANKPNK